MHKAERSKAKRKTHLLFFGCHTIIWRVLTPFETVLCAKVFFSTLKGDTRTALELAGLGGVTALAAGLVTEASEATEKAICAEVRCYRTVMGCNNAGDGKTA